MSLDKFIFLVAVASIPLFVFWILGPAVGGFRNAVLFAGPALSIIYPFFAVWLTYEGLRTK